MIHLALTIAAALFLGYIGLIVLVLLFGTKTGRELLLVAVFVGVLLAFALLGRR